MSAIKTFFKDILNHPEIILVIIGLIMGSIMLLITPPGEVPDEPCHLKRTAEVADGVFFSLKAVATSYDDSFKTLMEKHNFDYPLSNEFLSESRMSFIMYIPSALGIKAADLILHDTQVMFYFGRLFNLISYILLCFFAIKITPVFKYPFMFCALLPMALFEGMSVSADSFNNGFAFLFFAFIFKLIFEKKELTKKDFTILTIFTVIGAFCKGLIDPILLSVFFGGGVVGWGGGGGWVVLC
ncbi:MAG: DUF2142 domain-containing protein, partial [Candidatus Gastranaerophilales bacterium]|nr:DUF2142 domain-containing protein [Candidatus Gastranaerophilales bacterium]